MTNDPNMHAAGTTGEPADSESSTSATGSGSSDESFWQEPQARSSEWVAQLQAMIEQLTTQAAPVIREVGAKAAELAALAGEKAGPMAQRAAEFTAEAGMKLAERSRTFAAEIRRDQAARGEGPAADNGSGMDAETSDEPTTTGVA
jgi:hypothetical protein